MTTRNALYHLYYGYLHTLWCAGILTYVEFDRATTRLSKKIGECTND